MKVKCIDEEIIGEWLKRDVHYFVLEIYFGEKCMFRIVSDSSATPAFFEADSFEIIDGSIPKNWQVSIIDSSLFLGPERWRKIGFWEDFFDDEIEAIKIYNEEREIIERG